VGPYDGPTFGGLNNDVVAIKTAYYDAVANPLVSLFGGCTYNAGGAGGKAGVLGPGSYYLNDLKT